MDLPTKEAIDILTFLLPGFVAAWVYYGLTSFPKPSQFERVVQALIFTFLIQGLVYIQKWISLWVGAQGIVLGVWSVGVQLVFSIIIAFIFGLIFCTFSNNDRVHQYLRKRGITKLTSYPSEWYGAFANHQTYIVLHLNDNRRIYGWPMQWPSQPESGHFSIAEAEWLSDDPAKESIKLDTVGSILIPASEVKFVEFMKLYVDENTEAEE